MALRSACVILLLFHVSSAFGYEGVFRFAVGDVDGDGAIEVVGGGRVGPFLGTEAPLASRRAQVAVYRRQGQALEPVAKSGNLHVVADVGVGDVDGDGVDDPIVVGAGWLMVMAKRDDRLFVRTRTRLEGAWTDRVVAGDVDGDGKAEVGVTVYEIGENSEVGQTQIVFYTWRAGELRPGRRLFVPMHVGDLCLEDLDGVKGLELVVEVGTGEEGGEARVYRWGSGGYEASWQGRIAQDGYRILSLSGIPGPERGIVAGTPDGWMGVFNFDGRGLFLKQEISLVPGLSNAVLVPGQRRGLQVIGPAFRLLSF